jgi:hypothetical protein
MSELVGIRSVGPVSGRYKIVRYANGVVVYGYGRYGWFVKRRFAQHPWSVSNVSMREVLYYVRRTFG